MRRFARELVGLYWDSGVANDVPALAWFLLSSLVPLALGVTALAAVALGDYAEAQALSVRISKVLPEDVQDQLVALILRTQEQSPLLIAASIIGMVWVSSGAVGVIERCLLRLLARPSAGVVRGKLRNLAVAAVVTVVIMLMVAVATAGTDLVGRLKINPAAIRLAAPLTSLALSTLLCGAVFRALAGESLRWRAACATRFVTRPITSIAKRHIVSSSSSSNRWPILHYAKRNRSIVRGRPGATRKKPKGRTTTSLRKRVVVATAGAVVKRVVE